MKYLVGLFALVFAFTPAAKAQDFKVGVVDMSRILAEYYKTRDSEKELESRKEGARKEVEEQEAPLKELATKLEALQKSAQDPALSAELRQAKGKQLEEEVQKARQMQQGIIEFARRRESQLLEMFNRRRTDLLNEIKDKVAARSTADGYDLVFDRSARSVRGVPFLLYSKDARDFSGEMIAELNADAPKGE